MAEQVQGAEGFSKRQLFEILDDLEIQSRPIMEAARKTLASQKGDKALQPYNMSHALAGETVSSQEYFVQAASKICFVLKLLEEAGGRPGDSLQRCDTSVLPGRPDSEQSAFQPKPFVYLKVASCS